jgi:hypothetical protein
LDTKAQEIKDGLAALAAYRAGLVEEQRRADLWEREMLGMVEALATLQVRLDAGLAFEDKRAVVKALVKGILIKTQTGDDGKPFAVAHVTYRFEQPEAEAPIPLELTSLFSMQWRDIDNVSVQGGLPTEF